MLQPPLFVQREDDEASSASNLNYYGHELGVDGAEVAVVGIPGDPNAQIACKAQCWRNCH